ncbi:MAG: ABC transporter substrate-binding protein [Ornithinimicrobium sp.]
MRTLRPTVLLATTVLATVLAACAPSAPESAGDGASTGAEGTASDATLRIATTTDVVNFNPLMGNSRTDSWVTDLMYPRLLTINEDGSKEPYLATEWGYSEDGMAAFYEIRDDFQWSDGTPVTAKDVAYSINTVKEQNPTGNVVYGFMGNVVQATAVSDTRVEIELSQPDSIVVPEVGFWQVIVPEAQFGKHNPVEDFANTEDWVSAGPFVLTEANRGQSYTLERVENYPMAPGGTPVPAEVIFQVYPDVNTEILALQSGEVDVVANALPPAQVEPLRQADGVELAEVPGLGFTQMVYNLERKPLQDVQVREALVHAVDYEAIRKVAVQGQAISANSSPITPSLSEYVDPSWKENTFDIQESRRLLKEAGVEDLTLNMVYSMQDPVISAWATLVRDSAAEAGITIDLEGLDRNTYLAKVQEGDYDIYAGSFAIMDEPVSNMALQYLPDGAINYAHVEDPQLTDLIQQAQASVDDQERTALIQDAASRVRELYVDNIMYVQNLYVAHSDDWTNFTVRPSELLSIIDPESLANATPTN